MFSLCMSGNTEIAVESMSYDSAEGPRYGKEVQVGRQTLGRQFCANRLDSGLWPAEAGSPTRRTPARLPDGGA